MQTMEYSTLSEPTLITVGSIHSGDYMNIIPSELTMEDSIRCLHPNEKAVHARFRELVTAVCAACRYHAISIAEFFREGIPGIYYLIGTGNEQKASTAAQHSRDFRIDEDSLDIGIEMQIRVILSYLGV
ncbi:MAG TPA: hypothetical protein PKA19_09440 [Bacillota bacterium]|nr:hypothetical protein [Bacillota bacterium]